MNILENLKNLAYPGFEIRLKTALQGAVLTATVLSAAPVMAEDVLEAGKLLFTKTAVPACALCHTLKHAQAAGEIGPILDELKPDAARVELAIKNGIGQMPPFTQLTPAQITLLGKYVSQVAGQ